MNILIPHNWLLDHLDTEAKPEDIQKYLSLSGPSVEKIYEREGDFVYDVEVTTNRVDSMSVRGIAREAAVILSRAGIKAELKPLELPSPAQLEPKNDLPLPEIDNDPQLCNRILTAVLAEVDHSPTPEWMANRLRQVDLQVHHSMVDITNYITHDLGHPCHAFDYDKIMDTGGKIIVAAAEADQPFVTLDGEKYQTVGGEIVFENPQGEIIDLPAIKGTANTSVDDQTKNILLWIENLDPAKVRFASMTHAIRTVAAQLNEKNVDPHLAEPVLVKAIELYQSLTNAKLASPIHDQFPNEQQLQPVAVKAATIENYLGIELPPEEINQILTKLGCRVEVSDSNQQTIFLVHPPSFRPDLTIPADVIEEVARIYGYHQLPSELMAAAIPTNRPDDSDFALEEKLKQFLADIGWQEIYSYSTVSQELAAQSGYSVDQHLQLANPLTEDQVYLRRSLIPSLEQAIDSNPQAEQISVFELASVYHPRENQLPQQDLKIGLVSNQPYRRVRGEVEALLSRFYLPEVKVKPESDVQLAKAGQQAALMAAAETKNKPVRLGTISILNNGHTAIELDYQALLSTARRYPSYQPTPNTSTIIEDLTFTLAPNTPVGRVLEAIENTHDWVRSVKLQQSYQQNYTFTISYQDPSQNLSTDQVKQVRQQVVQQVKDQFQAELVGSV